MANNYCQASFVVPIRNQAETIAEAQAVINRFQVVLGDDMQNDVEIDGSDVWIHGEENFCPDEATDLVQLLLDELEIDIPIIFAWANTGGMSRTDEFGGGACLVRRGLPEVFINPETELQKLLEKENNENTA